jgi:di/tricarboxylate transporter
VDWEIVFTLSVVAGLFLALFANLGAPDLLFLSATAILALTNVITVDDAFGGFSNSGVLTVVALYVVAAGLRDTGILDFIGRSVLGRAHSTNSALLRLAGVVTPMSALLNNTPIVAMFMPIVIDWSRRHNVSPSKLLIPLSYVAILGGTCTLIGTSTNLIVHGLLRQDNLPGLGLFEMSPVGVPYAIIGIAYLYFIGRHILPNRKELLEQLGEARREYLSEMLVERGCRLVGQSVENAGLRQLPGLFLTEIDRGDKVISPVSPDEVIEADDQLVFAGIVSSIIELERIPGLTPAADPAYEVSPGKQRQRRLCEAVVSITSPLIGKSIRDADFRARFGAAVLAVHRGGERINEKIGDIQLAAGDTLLLQTQPHFLRAYRNDPAFYLVSNVDEWRPLRYDRAWMAMIIFALLIGLMVFKTEYTLLAAVVAALLLIATDCISAAEARKSIEWQVLVTIGASFGVGAALENSGAARYVAEGIVHATQWLGPWAALAVVYLLTSLVTEMITNNAAAVLMFPFCLEIGRLYNVSDRPFIMALIFAASASFMTPIGYQTNMMVYGPGGYRFADFFKIGSFLHLTLFLVAMLLIPWVWPFALP